jgi:hypothetical protein
MYFIAKKKIYVREYKPQIWINRFSCKLSFESCDNHVNVLKLHLQSHKRVTSLIEALLRFCEYLQRDWLNIYCYKNSSNYCTEKKKQIYFTIHFCESSAVLEIIRPKQICDAPPTDCAQPHTLQFLNFLLSALCRVLYSATRIQNLSS